jgi:hypothetical protein
MQTYEQRLDRSLTWALLEGSMHFEQKSAVHQTLAKMAKRLDALGVPYAVAGGMALFAHGFRRFTEDVDILVTREGLEIIHRQLEGLGYVPPFAGSKNLRDAEHGVRIEFLVAGDYPGDGKPKPIAFPDPSQANVEMEGIHYLRLTTLIELKLASGITNPLRLQDIVDVQRLIQMQHLPAELSAELRPFVREKYLELWSLVHDNLQQPE